MSRAEALAGLERMLELVPDAFVDDGCSAAPDRLFRVNLRPACRVHDWLYCTRAHPAGHLDQAHRTRADQWLGRWVRALLPLGLGWVGWLYWRATHRFGGTAAYDSCGLEAGDRCRHGLEAPAWLHEAGG